MIEVNVIMGAGMDSLVVDVVEVNVTMGAGRIYTDAMTVDTHVT